jgi:hypothetical protein
MDLRGLQDDITRKAEIDYFENTRRATLAHQQYAIQNPRRFTGYSEFGWGITASEGPAKDAPQTIGDRTFYNYLARGIPEPDDDSARITTGRFRGRLVGKSSAGNLSRSKRSAEMFG